jgi:hypothetical protein
LTLKLAFIAPTVFLYAASLWHFADASLHSPLARRALTVTILLPLILNLLVQAYGWILLLGPNGVLNSTLRSLGIIDRPIFLLFNETGVLGPDPNIARRWPFSQSSALCAACPKSIWSRQFATHPNGAHSLTLNCPLLRPEKPVWGVDRLYVQCKRLRDPASAGWSPRTD